MVIKARDLVKPTASTVNVTRKVTMSIIYLVRFGFVFLKLPVRVVNSSIKNLKAIKNLPDN